MLGIGLIVFCAVLWATDALFRMPLARSMSPATIVLFEHLLGTAAAFPWFFARRRELGKLDRRGWLAIAFVGLMGSAFATFFFTTSYRYINPSITILLQKLQPIFAVLGARLFLGEKPRGNFYAWALIALVGAAMISLPDGQVEPGTLRHLLSGAALAVAAAALWGLSTVFGKFVTGSISFPVTTFLRFFWGLVGITILVAFSMLAPSAPQQLTGGMMTSIAYMALIPGVLSIYLYYAGLQRTRASVATFAELFFPVTAVLINWRFLGQALNISQIAGMILILISVFFIGGNV